MIFFTVANIPIPVDYRKKEKKSKLRFPVCSGN
jgi:hypothetical protein